MSCAQEVVCLISCRKLIRSYRYWLSM
jgi:hypothetical protein